MKTAVFLSGILVGSSMLSGIGPVKNEATTFSGYKTSKSKVSSSLPVAPIRIVVDKSNYELYVYDAKGWYATYPVVFGTSTLDDKRMEGDKCTPEGSFRITAKRGHEKWAKFMALDYPTRESIEKFNARKQRGEIPKNASPGGGIGIHGTWPREDFVVDRYKNWTNGCIALKRSDVDELYSYVPVGTVIQIRK